MGYRYGVLGGGRQGTAAAYAMSLLDRPEDVFIWDGGIAQTPRPPFNYYLTFNIVGLTNEYYGTAHFIRDGKIVELPTFTEDEYERVEFPEAFSPAKCGNGASPSPKNSS